MYTVAKKDGTPRNTTLADARKLGLVPSVTGIINILDKPQLSDWKQEQAVLASLTLPRLDGEADQDFAKRVVADAREQVGTAADVGTDFHRFAEDYIAAGKDSRAKVLAPVSLPYKSVNEWVGWAYGNLGLAQKDFPENYADPGVSYCEVSVASAHGYGGKIDWVGRMSDGSWAVVDWKTQNVRSGKAPTFYEAYDLQLAAYANAVEELGWSMRLGIPWIDKRISVVISTNPDNPGCWAHEWDGGDKAFEAFKAALTIWKWQKNYDPSDVVITKEVAA
jgi:hypothetical protein